jgi:hypothetical protein
MEIALLIAQPNMSFAAVNQNDFILDQVPVLRYTRPGTMSSIPATRCSEPLFFGLTFSMNWEEAEALLSV